MSAVLKPSPTTRFEAKDEKATKRPLAEIAGNELSAFPWVPSELTPQRLGGLNGVRKR